jgi:hypothetical protein
MELRAPKDEERVAEAGKGRLSGEAGLASPRDTIPLAWYCPKIEVRSTDANSDHWRGNCGAGGCL